MPEIVLATLGAIVNLGGSAYMRDIEVESGFAARGIFNFTSRMIELGWVEKYHRQWVITERGKIALAIETGRRTKKQAVGCYYRPIRQAKFLGVA